MKKLLFWLIFPFLFCQDVFAGEFDAAWCTKNGGTPNYDIKINCVTNDIGQIAYGKRIYNALCAPYYSYIFSNKKPIFLQISVFINLKPRFLFDEFDLKISKDELLKYI